jgi:hypothetical protein
MNQHNQNADPGDSIVFQIGTGQQTIVLQASEGGLPTITTKVLIDATTQPGFSGTPLIQVNGQYAGVGEHGLDLEAGGCTIKGLIISNFDGYGIAFDTGAGGTVVNTCWIGTDSLGHTKEGNGHSGIAIFSSNNTIGGAGILACVISGNGENGILIDRQNSVTNANGNVIAGNYIGTDATGANALGNGGQGILIQRGASNNNIATGNVISGNTNNGVEIIGAIENSTGNYVGSNKIGTDASGTVKLANGNDGVLITGGAANNTIGSNGNTGNIISGNASNGVELTTDGTTAAHNNLVAGNYIGLTANGQVVLANALDGVRINSSNSNTIGGGGGVGRTGAGNVISGNTKFGTEIRNNSSQNSILGNYIGTDSTGTAKNLGNQLCGVYVSGANNNTIGADGGAPSNVISGNGFGTGSGIQATGISLANSGSNVILGNFIGTDKGGTQKIGNNQDGIYLDSNSGNNTIGGARPTARNISSANGGFGIYVAGADNLIEFNYFGLDKNGGQLPNTEGGSSVVGPGNTYLNNQVQNGPSPVPLSATEINSRDQQSLVLVPANRSSSPAAGMSLLSKTQEQAAIGRFAPPRDTRILAAPSGGAEVFDFLFADGYW